MREFRNKQKKLNRIMKALIIFGAAFIFIYIGVQPFIAEKSQIAAMVLNYACDFLVIANMFVVFRYYSKYGKSDSFLNSVENELSDYGFYYSARAENDEKSYISAIQNDLMSDGYQVNTKVEASDFEFDVIAFKRKEFFYVVNIEDLTKNDIIAHIDAVVNDITVQNLKRVGSAVVCFVTDKAQEDAISLSKMITPLGKKENIKIAVCIVEPESKRCYFLGNVQTKCQQMIVNYVMNCAIPIEDKYKGDKRIAFQDELEKHMNDFNIKDFKNGTFYAH